MKSIVFVAVAVIGAAGLVTSDTSKAQPGTSHVDLGETILVLPSGYGGGQSKKQQSYDDDDYEPKKKGGDYEDDEPKKQKGGYEDDEYKPKKKSSDYEDEYKPKKKKEDWGGYGGKPHGGDNGGGDKPHDDDDGGKPQTGDNGGGGGGGQGNSAQCMEDCKELVHRVRRAGLRQVQHLHECLHVEMSVSEDVN